LPRRERKGVRQMKKRYVMIADVDFEVMFQDFKGLKGRKPKDEQELENYVWQAFLGYFEEAKGIYPIKITEQRRGVAM
jgi:hypothetical protein